MEMKLWIIYVEWLWGPYSAGMVVLIDGDWKISWWVSGNCYELFDLVVDLGELIDLMRI